MSKQAAGYSNATELFHGGQREDKEIPWIPGMAPETAGDKREIIINARHAEGT